MLKLKRAQAKADFNERVFVDANDDPILNNWHHEQWYELMELHRYLLIQASREHAKTEVGVKCNALFEMGVDPNTRILIVSDIHDKAQDRARLLRHHIERNSAYRAEFPHVRIAKKEGDHTFTLVRDRIQKEPTITSTYAGGAISGNRYDVIICDDMVNLLKNSYTPEQRRKLREWFYRDVINSLTQHGKLLILGTPQHHDDLHDDIAKDPRFKVVSYPGVDEVDTGYGDLGYATKNQARGITGPDAICLWPAMHDHKAHMAKKEGNYDTFLSQQQLQNVPSAGLVYRRVLTDAAFERGKDVEYDPQAEQYLGIDPGYAIRCAMLAIQERTGDRIDIWREHSFTELAADEIAKVATEHCEEFRVRAVFVDAEDKGFALALSKSIEARGLSTLVQPVPFNKFKRNAIHATRWLLGSDRVAWKADETIVHKPGRSGERARVEPSLFREEIRDYALRPGTDDEPIKDDDHGPDAWTAYCSKWVVPWAKAMGIDLRRTEEQKQYGGLTRVK